MKIDRGDTTGISYPYPTLRVFLREGGVLPIPKYGVDCTKGGAERTSYLKRGQASYDEEAGMHAPGRSKKGTCFEEGIIRLVDSEPWYIPLATLWCMVH